MSNTGACEQIPACESGEQENEQGQGEPTAVTCAENEQVNAAGDGCEPKPKVCAVNWQLAADDECVPICSNIQELNEARNGCVEIACPAG